MNENTIEKLKMIRAIAANTQIDIKHWLEGNHKERRWLVGDTDLELLNDLKGEINNMHSLTLRAIREEKGE